MVVDWWVVRCPNCGNYQISHAGVKTVVCNHCNTHYRVRLKTKPTSYRVKATAGTLEEARAKLEKLKRKEVKRR